jgi:hypothetical protein
VKGIDVPLWILFAGLTGFALGGCNKSPDARAVGQVADSTAQAGLRPPDSAGIGSSDVDTAELGKVAPFPGDGSDEGASVYYIPWENKSIFSHPLSEDSAEGLTIAFFAAVANQYAILPNATNLANDPAPDSTQLSTQQSVAETLDFRECGGSSHFSTLDHKEMAADIIFGSAPIKGLTYQILGKRGALIRAPLVFDSMMANIYVEMGDDSVKAPVWRATCSKPGIQKAIGTLQGNALVLGSKLPLRNVAVKPAPISDSLKLAILKGILPDMSMLRIFSGIEFYSAGSDGSTMRCLIIFRTTNEREHMCAVEVVDGKSTVLFQVNTHESKNLEFFLSLTESPLADVFVIRIYEVKHVIRKEDGKWEDVGGIEYNDMNNYGC